jgi:hypothetical protein
VVVRISSTIFVSEHGPAAALVPLARPSCTARRPPPPPPGVPPVSSLALARTIASRIASLDVC